MAQIYDMLVIGGGPGGYTAALYAARAGLSVVVLEKLSAGGQMASAEQIDNYPGFSGGIDGFTLGENMQQQAERFGAVTVLADVLSLRLGGRIKEAETGEGLFLGKTVVFSTGANPRRLGLSEEKAYVGRGIHYCAACDGMRYKGKTVLVIGGGNSAAADALILRRIAKKVILVHRRDTLRATKIYHTPLMSSPNVEFLWNSTLVGFLHDNAVTGGIIENTKTGQRTHILCDGIFVSIGRVPASELAAGQLSLDADGYILADESTRTNLPGVYAVGDVRQKVLRQIVTAVADGAVAAHYAEAHLATNFTDIS